MFKQHHGRVVKLLGDGLFVVLLREGDALAACINIHKRLQDNPIHPGGQGAAVQMQIGMDLGDMVEIDGDCFGDTVNSAARLAVLAGGGQILTTQNVWAAAANSAGIAAQHGAHVFAQPGRRQPRIPGRVATRARRRSHHRRFWMVFYS